MFTKTPILVLIVLTVGCASSQKPKWNGTTFFTNQSVRVQDPPRTHWSRQDEELLLRRMGYADMVAVGTLRLVTQCNRSEVARQLTLAFHPQEELFGALEEQLDGAGEVLIQLDPSSEDFNRALNVQQEMVGTRYLVFFKREPRSGKLHWAFYSPSDRLLTEVRARYRWLSKKPTD